MLTIDPSAVGPIILVLILSSLAGGALYLLGLFVSGAAQLIFGVVEAIAGGRSSGAPESHRNKGVVFLRAVIYLAVCIGAIVLSLTGHQGLAYACAVAGGVTLPIAVIKLLG